MGENSLNVLLWHSCRLQWLIWEVDSSYWSRHIHYSIAERSMIVTYQFKSTCEENNSLMGNSSSSSSPSKNKNKTGSIGITSEEKNDTPRLYSSTNRQNRAFSRSKSYSNGASYLFRNLITCGTVDSRDSTTVLISRRNKPSLSTNTNTLYGDQSSFDRIIELCKGDKLGGSQRVFGTSMNQPPQFARRSYDGARSSSNSKSSEFTGPKPNAAYKPINGPQCSHMKSCKGLITFSEKSSDSTSLDLSNMVLARTINRLIT